MTNNNPPTQVLTDQTRLNRLVARRKLNGQSRYSKYWTTKNIVDDELGVEHRDGRFNIAVHVAIAPKSFRDHVNHSRYE